MICIPLILPRRQPTMMRGCRCPQQPTTFKYLPRTHACMQRTEIISASGIPAVDLALDTLRQGKQALVFVNTKRSAEKVAEDIAKKLKADDALAELSSKVLHALQQPTVQCERLAKAVLKGIAYHHAGLVHEQKELVEEHFRQGKIRIICCTPTLAQGLDLPAFRAIIRDLKRHGQHGLSWIPVLEYHQQAGRAGRPKYDTYGEAICIAGTKPEKEIVVEKYINGKPEDIVSKLAAEPALRTYVLSLLASGVCRDLPSLLTFFGKTFYAHQYQDMAGIQRIIGSILGQLEEWEFIRRPDFVSASDMGERITVTPIGKRVAELYIDPYTASHLVSCLQRAGSRKMAAFAFLQMISHSLEMRPLLHLRMREYDIYQEKLAEHEDVLFDEEPGLYDPEYEEFMDSIKTASCLAEWIEEQSDNDLMDRYAIRPGELRSKMDIADWLLYCSAELARMLHFQPLLKEVMKVRIRMMYGIKEELLPLVRLRQVGRVRARILFRNGIRDIGDVKKADISLLRRLLGPHVAASVKEQVGQKTEQGTLPAF